VLGDIDSLREVWGDAAVFVNPKNSHELKCELLNLINDDELRLHMAQRARERALEFTNTRMAENYFAAYAELLGDARGAYRQCA
jgi:glycosyltransferase involved in cell wall biosynthesis